MGRNPKIIKAEIYSRLGFAAVGWVTNPRFGGNCRSYCIGTTPDKIVSFQKEMKIVIVGAGIDQAIF